MTFIELKEDQRVHVKSIDEAHDEIAESISRLYELVNKGSLEEQIAEMEHFQKILNEHFDHEDNLMKEYKDPGFISHKLEHNRMRLKTQRVLDSLNLNKEKLQMEYVTGLRNWLENHLIFKDIKLGEYLNSLGVYE